MKKSKPDRRKRPDHPALAGDLKSCPVCHKMTLVYAPRGESLEQIAIKVGLDFSETEEVYRDGPGWFCPCGNRIFDEEKPGASMIIRTREEF